MIKREKRGAFWFDEKCRKERKKVRKLFKKFTTCRTAFRRLKFVKARTRLRKLYDKKKQNRRKEPGKQ